MTYQEQNPTMGESQNSTQVQAPSDSELITQKLTRAVWIFATVMEALLGFRFILKLFAANPNNLFASMVYAASDVLVFPFQNLVGNITIVNSVFELTTLIAILVYLFLTWLLIQFLILVFKR
jgi:YggT family protein